MIITPRKESILGLVTNYYECLAKVPTNNWVMFLHGAGEVGPADGSKLQEVLKLGWPKHAKAGFEFPFNMIIPQAVANHNDIVQVLPAWMNLYYGATTLVTGLSLGGYGTYDTILHDDLKLVCAIAPVCGAGRITFIDKYKRHVPAWHFHGALDPKVKLPTAKGFIDKYNSMYDPNIKLTVYPDVGHEAWVRAYSIDGTLDEIGNRKDQLLQWAIQKFAEAPKVNLDEIKRRIMTMVQLYGRTRNDMDQAVFQIEESIK